MENPFTTQDLAEIEKAIGLALDLIPVIQKAELCGGDCQQLRTRLELVRSRLDKYKQEFFKGGKPLQLTKANFPSITAGIRE